MRKVPNMGDMADLTFDSFLDPDYNEDDYDYSGSSGRTKPAGEFQRKSKEKVLDIWEMTDAHLVHAIAYLDEWDKDNEFMRYEATRRGLIFKHWAAEETQEKHHCRTCSCCHVCHGCGGL